MEVEKVAEHIVQWLKSYATNAKTKGFVVGVSGGIDSAVTSSLCAMTGLPTLCLEMPIHQAKDQSSRAHKHVLQLCTKYKNVKGQHVDLSAPFDEFSRSVVQDTENPRNDLSLANARARLRMSTLYYYAGIHQYLVAGTGNKVEDFGVGFYTKYGDGGVDLSPIADLLKSEVFALGRFLGIIREIIEAAPTDGLYHDSKTDEQQLGATYDELEWAMKMSQESDQNTSQLSPRQEEVLSIYQRLNRANQHKMNPIPVCIIPEDLR
jgi:NAD+ synthase